ncbi:hypothetical protein PC129_g18233 [Phytophthora cactorum]|uniref:Uncharacterized protein n=1 Tax=Phytophthora cactorum TaxID=29920 RepID=A0A329REP1_9STRA|nr:hypothetical protein Pcac1_g17821 [Phytophthora cactorum]KAG2803461.1 hypothetical protein PC111_g18678 [Phytophthora cactorum]KAG2841757.1 hypothetical protein PC112_g3234 [Phytophthora cactorum]KAG2858546.1 hypothetical protein PC113_g9724 [Phytophthora cactorum]KAG2884674.1 hypothetical protein PC114_g19974 [Phytophthora cactorum]
MSPTENWANREATSKKPDVEWNKDGKPVIWND